jgi:hypothetical protein
MNNKSGANQTHHAEARMPATRTFGAVRRLGNPLDAIPRTDRLGRRVHRVAFASKTRRRRCRLPTWYRQRAARCFILGESDALCVRGALARLNDERHGHVCERVHTTLGAVCDNIPRHARLHRELGEAAKVIDEAARACAERRQRVESGPRQRPAVGNPEVPGGPECRR